MYEVQNRSLYEHQSFSFEVERRNLKWLNQANSDFVQEMTRVTYLETLADHGQLKGKAFKHKALNPRRVKGLAAFGFAGYTWTHLVSLKLLLGPTAPLVGIVSSLLYGLTAFNERSLISAIVPISEGQFAGKVRVTIQESPIVSRSIVVDPRVVRSIASLGDDDMGEEDTEGNIVEIDSAFDEATGNPIEGGVFTLPADAFRDLRFMEWFLAPKNAGSKTDALFNDLVFYNHAQITATGGLTGISAYNARSTGFANANLADEVDKKIDENKLLTDETLEKMSEHFGQEKLGKMEPSELYRNYRDFVAHKN